MAPLLAVELLFVGCSANQSAPPERFIHEVPSSIALSLSDLPQGFQQGASQIWRNGTSGSVGGWHYDFARSGVVGATFISSGVDFHSSDTSARAAIEPLAGLLPTAARIDADKIGDASLLLIRNDNVDVSQFVAIFAVANVASLVIVGGPRGSVDKEAALAIARKQVDRQRRYETQSGTAPESLRGGPGFLLHTGSGGRARLVGAVDPAFVKTQPYIVTMYVIDSAGVASIPLSILTGQDFDLREIAPGSYRLVAYLAGTRPMAAYVDSSGALITIDVGPGDTAVGLIVHLEGPPFIGTLPPRPH
jgi:hypothetical protein